MIAATPLLAPLLDRWSFRPTLEPLVFLSVALLACWMIAGRTATTVTDAPAHRRRDLMLIGAAALLIPALLLPGWPSASGDEPHYLITARSIWNDADLDLAADYGEQRYLADWLGPLAPHAKPGKDPATRYSSHGVGYAALLVPAVAAAAALEPEFATALARSMQMLVFALFAMLLYLLVEDIAGPSVARCGVLATTLLAPVVFAPLSLFPETVGMTLACAAYLLMRRPERSARVLAGGALAATLPWIAIKFVPLSLALVAIGVCRGTSRSARLRIAAWLVVPLAASTVAHLAFTQTLYGTLNPAAIYVGASPESGRHTGQGSNWGAYFADLPGAARTWLGYWLDQKDSALAAGPHLLIGIAAIPLLLRLQRFEGLALVLVALAHSAPYALSQELGGQSLPARPLLPVVWTLALPLGLGLTRRRHRVAGWLSGALLAAGVATTLVLAANPGLLTHDYNVKMSRLLLAYSPAGTELWRAFPLWVNFAEPQWAPTFLWLAATALAIGILARTASAPAAPPDSYRHLAAGAALASVVLATAHLAVMGGAPVSDGHVGAEIAPGIRAWVEGGYPETAWAEPGGVWVRPGHGREIVFVSDRPLDEVEFAIRSLVDNDISLRFGEASSDFELASGPGARQRLAPGRGWRFAGGYAYRAVLEAADGRAPAQIEPSADYRVLGANLTIAGVTYAPTSSPW